MVSLVIAAQGPFDLQLTSLPSFATEMSSLVHLEISNHSFGTIPTYFIFSFPNLETLKLQSNGIRAFLTAEEKPVSVATSASTSRSGSTSATPIPVSVEWSSEASTDSLSLGSALSKTHSDSASSTTSSSPSEEGWRYESVTSMVQKRGTPKLRHLDLSNNVLTVLPAHISVLSNLTYLDVSNNWLKVLPEELTSMPIATLLVENNQVFDLPIANALSTVSPLMYSSLTELNISNNGIKLSLLSLNRALLQNLPHYQKLTRLELAHNTLTTLPPSVRTLAPKFTSLNLSHISLRALVAVEIKQFSFLRVLDVSHNGLTSLPSELCTLVFLEALDVSHNELTSLPQGLPGLCHNLIKFYLGRNKLRSLPNSFSTLTKLTHLDLGGNQLADSALSYLVPLIALERLDLRANLFTTLPVSLAPLSNLIYLSAASNMLTQVPALPFFGKLEELDLNETPTLHTLPKLCSELSSLRCLHVAQAILQFEFSAKHSKEMHTRFPSHADNKDGKTPNATLNEPRGRTPSDRYETRSPTKSDAKYGRQRKVEVTVLDAEKIGLEQLISLMRSCPHEIILGGMTKLCMDPNWHSSLLKANLVNELSFLLLSSDLPLAQVRTLMAIKTICKNLGNHNFIGEDKQILGCLADILTTNLPKALDEKRANLLLRLALDSLCYLSYDPALRHMINNMPTDQSISSILSATEKAPNPAELSGLSSVTITPAIDSKWQTAFGLPEMVRYLSTLKDRELSSRAKRTMNGIGLMPKVISPKGGIRVLSIDGGGTRGFIVLAMLAVLERLTGKKISEMFDLIVGTSTGGLISSLVAWSPISMEEAKPYYRIWCRSIFTPKGQPMLPPSGVTHKAATSSVPTLFGAHDDEDMAHRVHGSTDMLQSLGSSGSELRSSLGASDPSDALSSSSASHAASHNSPPQAAPSQASTEAEGDESAGSRWLSSAPWQRLTGLISMLQTRAYYETSPMEQVLKDMAGEHVSLLDTAMYTNTKFAAVCARVNAFPPQPYILRNYNHPDAPASKGVTTLEGNATFRVWESIRATTAAPGYFDPVIKDGLHLVDGAMIYNNPIALAIMEAKNLWPDQPIGCIVSCGTGARPSHPIDVTMGSLLSDLVDSATETEKTAMLARAALSPDIYFRLQPQGEVFDFPIDETRPERFDAMEQFMSTWLEENGALFLQIAEALKNEE